MPRPLALAKDREMPVQGFGPEDRDARSANAIHDGDGRSMTGGWCSFVTELGKIEVEHPGTHAAAVNNMLSGHAGSVGALSHFRQGGRAG